MIKPDFIADDQIKEVLNKNFFNLFGDLTEEQKAKILQSLEWKSIKRGEMLFHQNDEADGLYTLLIGKLEAIVTDFHGNEKVVGYVNASETVGEMALITGDKRSASIRCYRNATLVKISNQAFIDLCSKNPQFAINVSKIVVKRLKSSFAAKKDKQLFTNVAFFRADQDINTSSTLSLLIRLYTKNKNNYVFNIISLKKRLGISPTAEVNESHKTAINRLFNELEIQYQNIIIDLRGFTDDMIRFLLDYCDLCIIFRSFGVNPKPPKKEMQFYDTVQEMKQKLRLIFCHNESAKLPSGTRKWLDLRPNIRHAHIRKSNQKDVERIYRYLTGQSISLVLGGGGAKGIAHLGILKSLYEKNIPIDYICGTSMGSIIAGVYALNQNIHETLEICRDIFLSNPTPKNDLNIIPKYSIYKGKKIEALLNRYLTGVDIEDLWLPFFCVASNISNPGMEVLVSGSAKTAIRSSMSVPGLFPPVIHKNNVLVDGALFNNIPIDLIMRENVGKIIACRVNKEPEVSQDSTIQTKMPLLLTNFMKSIMAYSDSLSENLKQHVDLYFEPDVSKYGMLSWKSTDKIIEIGYKHAKKVLSKVEDLDSYKMQ